MIRLCVFHQGQIIRSSLNDYLEENHLGGNGSPIVQVPAPSVLPSPCQWSYVP